MNCSRLWCKLIIVLGLSMMLISFAKSYPLDRYSNEKLEIPDEIILDLLAKFGQTLLRDQNEKRTVDFGLARGFSGVQEAKHRMGLAAASYPGGPGRRRRSDADV